VGRNIYPQEPEKPIKLMEKQRVWSVEEEIYG
jgi:hypothetical protein